MMFDQITAKDMWGIFSVILALVGYGTYIRDVFKAGTKPHAFSWVVWGTVTAVVFFAQISKQGGAGAWVIGVSSVFCYSIAGLAMWRGEKDITWGDWLTFLGALLAIPIWLLTHDPLWSVVLVTIIDGIAYYPTVRKSYLRAHEESIFMYALDTVKCGASIIALEHYSVTTLFYPVIIIGFNWAFVVMVLWRRRALIQS